MRGKAAALVALGGLCNVAHFVCNFLVNIIGNNGKNCPARKQAQTMATAGEEEGVGGCCNNCLKCVSELNIPWSAVVHRRMSQLK